MRHLLLLFLLFFCLTTLANETVTHDPTPKSLTELQAQYRLLLDLKNQKQITKNVFDERKENLIRISEDDFDITLGDDLMEEIVTKQKIDWIGSAFYAISALLLFAISFPLFKLLWKIIVKTYCRLQKNPAVIKFARAIGIFLVITLELWAAGILIGGVYWYNNEYTQLLVTLLFSGLISFSFYARDNIFKKAWVKQYQCWVFTALWIVAAYVFDNNLIGFTSIAFLAWSLDFTWRVSKIGISAGFSDESKIIATTITCLLISLLAWLVFYSTYLPLSTSFIQRMDIYRLGLVSIIPLAFFGGLGYVAHSFYNVKPLYQYISEAIAFICGSLVILIALMYSISSMFWIGLIFMTTDLVLKYYRYVYYHVSWMITFMIASIVLGLTGYLIKSNMTIILNTLSSLNL